MKKIEQITCKKCSAINPLYTSICINCKSYLRERAVNIDLWKTIGQIIETPSNAFRQIIYAENKNFIIFISLFLAIKNLIIARFLSVPLLGKDGVTVPFIFSYLLILLFTIIIFSGFSFLQKAVYSRLDIKLRFKDIYAMNVYSFIPLIISLFFIFPVELVVLGGDIFSNNPNPFQIKPTISYSLLGFEIIVFFWSIFLFNKSILFITGKIILSLLLTLLLFLVLLATCLLASQIIF
ncbi:MAG: hypothetical protein WAV89_04260 [Ignavibacteriaceae bacterium]